MSRLLALLALLTVLTAPQPATAQGHHRIGAGLHYWKTIDEIDVEEVEGTSIKDDGVSWILSYQYSSSPLVRFEADILIMPETYAAARSGYRVWGPQAMLLVGPMLYGGIGVGIYRAGDEWADDPFFPLRAGIDLEILPKISLDINANYRIEQWNMQYLEDNIDTDTVTLGAIVRLQM
ncbi:MAG: hypothetical protein MUE60_12415 [Candidatus Eisenbacteria bacterium]|jgi:hypothetical protein|nr:hypothetical protein [Candidatus Eisenbacteria bacterium]